jgi:hypothetical protein
VTGVAPVTRGYGQEQNALADIPAERQREEVEPGGLECVHESRRGYFFRIISTCSLSQWVPA